MKDIDPSEIKLSIAPKEKLRFISPRLQSLFLKEVLERDGAFITDESRLSDFAPPNDIDCKHRELANGKCAFSITVLTQVNGVKVREKSEFESYPVHFRIDVLRKTEDLFEVDIAHLYNEPIADILYFILTNVSEKIKKELCL